MTKTVRQMVLLCLSLRVAWSQPPPDLSILEWSPVQDGPLASDPSAPGQDRFLPRFRPPGFVAPAPLPCPPGWSRWQGKCRDVDECAEGTHECRSERTRCLNTLGSHRCLCQPGLVGDHYTTGCKTPSEYCRQQQRRDGPP